MKPLFQVENLEVQLKGRKGLLVPLVRNVSFSVAPGECLGILGESGSGKSLTLKAAMGLLDSSFQVTGSVQFQGQELLTKSSEELRRLRGGKVGIILQNPMTCFDPLYRIGSQLAETFAAHGNWRKGEIRERSLTVLEKNAHPPAGRSAGKISPPTVRRNAAADYDRHCSGPGAGASDCRRAHYRH